MARFDNQVYNRRMVKTDRNAEIVRLRKEESLTLDEIGARYDVSPQRVSAIVKRDSAT